MSTTLLEKNLHFLRLKSLVFPPPLLLPRDGHLLPFLIYSIVDRK